MLQAAHQAAEERGVAGQEELQAALATSAELQQALEAARSEAQQRQEELQQAVEAARSEAQQQQAALTSELQVGLGAAGATSEFWGLGGGIGLQSFGVVRQKPVCFCRVDSPFDNPG